MRIYVVDDEPRQRHGMEQLIHNLYPDSEILSFNNGKAAEESMSLLPPDILVSDIRMPHETGLELADVVHQRYPHAPVILISAYAEFEYAQKAISLGVFDYIIKPVQPSAVAAVMKKAVERLQQEKARNHSSSSQTPSSESEEEERWLSLFLGNGQTISPDRLQKLLPHPCGGRIAKMILQSDRNIAEQDSQEIGENLKYWFRNVFPSCNLHVHFSSEANQLFALLFQDPIPKEKTNHLLESLEKDYGLVTNLLISRFYNNLHESFSEALREISELQIFLFYSASRTCMIYDSFLPPAPIVPFCSADVFHALLQLLYASRPSEAVGLGKNILLDFSSQHISPAHLKDAVIHLTLSLFESVFGKETRNHLNCSEKAIADIRAAVSFEELQNKFADIILFICQEIRKNQQSDISIKQALLYMEENYASKISLADVASLCHYSVSYFSSIFKMQTGVSFIASLNEIRIRHAVSLLASTSFSVNEIASQVGIQDINYFNRLFRRKYGMTAQAYREKLQKGDQPQ